MSRRRRVGRACTAAVLVAAFTAGCATPRPALAPVSSAHELVVLVPEPGRDAVGRAVVDDGSTSVILVRAGEAAELSAGRRGTRVLDDAEIARRFGAVIAALPPEAEHFDLYFDIGDTRLTDDSQALLPQIVVAVRQRPFADVSIIGHTDAVGRRAANVRLGLRRARVVERLLLDEVATAAIEVTSHGEADPLVPTRDGRPEPRNRRARVSVR